MNEPSNPAREPSGGVQDGSSDRAGIESPRSGLLARIVVSVAGLALGLALISAILLLSVIGLRDRSFEARRSQQVIATANGLQTLVIDLQTGLRGYAITKQKAYLQPWSLARARIPAEVRELLRLTANDPGQHSTALKIQQAIHDYVTVYSQPLVSFLEGNPGVATQIAISQEGAQRVDAIRGLFSRFLSAEQARGAARDRDARATAHNAILIGAVSLGATLLFLLAAAIYLQRAIVWPTRLVALAARRLATGDLTGRAPTGGPGEVGILEQSFNTMADSLQRGRDDLEERNQQLVESERLKTELVSNVSHELRTPLASVLGFSDLMLKRDIDPTDQRRYLELIRSESARLATLLNDLLDLQRQELGVLQLSKAEFDLNELLQVQVTLYSAQSEKHELSFTTAREPLLVQGDRDRLAQVIGNLLSNAIKYSPEGGTIEVVAAARGDEAWVWVRDEGLGIPPDQQDRVFTKFFRGDVARERGIAGTGLGLVLASQIVEAHGGTIGFDSDEEGSTFWVRIPALTPASGAAADDEAKARYRV